VVTAPRIGTVQPPISCTRWPAFPPTCDEAYRSPGMCVQYMMTAAASVSTASGIRVWLGSRARSLLTPKRLRLITIALFALAVLASGLFVSGSSSPAGG
jgi:hypothetical protein